MSSVRRKKLGKLLATEKKVEKKGGVWLVKSEHDNNTKYEVKNGLGGFFCTCPDYTEHEKPCKHIYAVQEVIKAKKTGRKLRPLKSLVIPRPTYPQHWVTYNKAQAEEKERMEKLLKELCLGLPERERKPGRPHARMKDIVFAATMKVYGTLSGRRSSTDLKVCQEKAFIKKVPHYNTISKYLNDQELTPILQNLIRECAKSLIKAESVFAIDSTGVATFDISRWFDEKFGQAAHQRDWLKLHISIGINTHIIAGLTITDSNVNDATQFRLLVEETAKTFNIKEVLADKAYLGTKAFEVVEMHGARAYIPFKKNSTGAASSILKRNFDYYKKHRRMHQKHYSQRNNVEAAMRMIKSKFSESIRSKNDTSRINEILCKLLCHNLVVLVHHQAKYATELDFWNNEVA